MTEFSIALDVRWGDVDSFGHVNNAAFLAYLEQCRSEWMNSVPCHWQQQRLRDVPSANQKRQRLTEENR